MNNSVSKQVAATDTSLSQDVFALLKHWVGGRGGLLFIALAVAGGGLWLGWPTLVAAGIAPLVLGVLPCVAMCALGLCMKGAGRSCDAKADTPTTTDSTQQNESFQRKEIIR